MANQAQPKQEPPPSERGGIIGAILRFFLQGLLRLLGLGGQGIRRTTQPLDIKYQEFMDIWVSERLAAWLHETRPDINTAEATKVLLAEKEVPSDLKQLIQETLIDAKVTFSQRDGKQYLEVEAYMAPKQVNGKAPQILRWRAERETSWQEIPNDVRERLIRVRQPVTLEYSIPKQTAG